MSRFKVARPNQEVRLKKWAPGRVAQLKLFLAHLEGSINNSLAAQVAQSPSRKFSEFVPIIPPQNFEGKVAFREIQVEFVPPKGQKDFLFYEWQISIFSNFASFDGFFSPDPGFVFSGLADAVTYFIRARVVTKSGLVGPFSETITGTTPAAKSRQSFDGTENEFVVNGPNFVKLIELDHEGLGGSVYYSIQYSVESVFSDDIERNIFWSDIEFQWKENDKQIGQNFLVTSYGCNSVAPSPTPVAALEVETADIGDLTVAGEFLDVSASFTTIQHGTFVQKLHSIAEETVTVSLYARSLPPETHATPNDFVYSANSEVIYGRRATVKLKNFSLFEVTTGA